MTDKYEALRAALPELVDEARRQGGINPRAQMIIDLLAERDKLRSILSRCVTRIKTDRDELELCAIDPKTGTVTDQATRDAIAEYDTLLAASVSALIQHKEEQQC